MCAAVAACVCVCVCKFAARVLCPQLLRQHTGKGEEGVVVGEAGYLAQTAAEALLLKAVGAREALLERGVTFEIFVSQGVDYALPPHAAAAPS